MKILPVSDPSFQNYGQVLTGYDLTELLAKRGPEALTARFKIVPEEGMTGWDLLEQGGRKRGFLISGGEVDLERMSNILLDEFRGGKLGRITLELPEDLETEADHGEA